VPIKEKFLSVTYDLRHAGKDVAVSDDKPQNMLGIRKDDRQVCVFRIESILVLVLISAHSSAWHIVGANKLLLNSTLLCIWGRRFGGRVK
jgi:hypothetical protein